ncbi:MAG: SUMF1/EgtB/PvdO family nonheme iron enzyme [Chloroflexi bacterium]|nr:SUMF1/EgtB/PvdO family nonheme iron enzyme [Chloroflexota bacterium]
MSAIILIVDDNHELVDGVKLALEMEDFQVLSATSGAEALNILDRITPDLILADIMMPEMDGYELYERVHSDPRWIHTPFIFLTAKTSPDDIRKGKEMGVDDYITKPFDPQDMIAAVRGRIKRMNEVTGTLAPEDVGGNIKNLWRSKVGQIRFKVLVFAGIIILISISIMLTLQIIPRGTAVFTSPLSSVTDEASPTLSATDGMIAIPAGEFLMGSGSAGAQRARQVNLPAFEIDEHEVINAQYKVFAQETDRPISENIASTEMENHPVTDVSWQDAHAYCEWAGKRLPTEAEWEKAARGTEGFIYPWGNEWHDDLANTRELGMGGTMPVASFSDGVSPYRVQDMAGNVWEWVDDWATPTQESKVNRGGAWNAISQWAQTFARNTMPPTHTQNNLGFRCAR